MSNRKDREDGKQVTLLETLEEIKTIASEYRKYEARMSRRFLWPPTYVRILIFLFRSGFHWKMWREDKGKERYEIGRQLIYSYTTASQRKSPYFDICAARFRFEALADHVRKRTQRFDAEALLSVHTLTGAKLGGLNIFKPLAVVLTAGTFLLHEVPDAILNLAHITKDAFDLVVFSMTCVTMAYLLLIIGPFYLMDRGRNKTCEIVGNLLAVMAAQDKCKLD